MTNMNGITKSIATGASKVAMKLRKYSPEILVGVGTVGVIVSTVLACKATTKVECILSETNERIEKINEAAEAGNINGHEYTEEDKRKDSLIVYAQTGVKFAKLYAPAVIVGMLSLGSIFASTNILRKRNLAIGAAFAAVDKSFKEYRKRVLDRYGEQVDSEMKYGIKIKKFDEIEVDESTGKEKKVKKNVVVADPNLESDYAVYFDEKSPNYEPNYDYNMMFVKSQQAYANDRLQAKGCLFLNDVYDSLGLPLTKAGQIVGWTKDGPDGYVNFRIQEVERETADGGHEPVILLDFNVEGNVWDKM